MPSRKSLADTQYYAHPRNAFWPIVGRLFGFDPRSPYAERLAALVDARVALWDVIARCARESSLDSDIVERSIVANDFGSFFAEHGRVRAIFFNGLKAEQSYRKYVAPFLNAAVNPATVRLPSTSPAHAGMAFEAKLEAWRAVAEAARCG